MRFLALAVMLLSCKFASSQTTPVAAEPAAVKPTAFPTLVNPSCSHCVDEAKRRSGELTPDEPALCWIRGYSDGGAIPLRFFLSKYRVISDSYGVFVFDPDAGFARGFAPSYNFVFHGWRHGIVTIKDTADGTVFSALSGIGIEGPRKGERLPVVPTVTTTWGEALARAPNAVAYEMRDKFTPVDLPAGSNADSVKSRLAKVDGRLEPGELVLGVRLGNAVRAFPLKDLPRPLGRADIDATDIVLFGGDQATTVAAYKPVASQPRKWKGPKPDKNGMSPGDPGEPLPDGKVLPNRTLTFTEKGGVITDRETGTRWGLDGRGIKGELNGWTLEWVDGVACKWFAWVAEYPETTLDEGTPKPGVPGTKSK